MPPSRPKIRELGEPIRESIMHRPVDRPGFAPPAGRPLGRERRIVARAELLATLGLVIGTAVAAIAVSAGMAEADLLAPTPRPDTGLITAAGVTTGLLTGIAGLTAFRRRATRQS